MESVTSITNNIRDRPISWNSVFFILLIALTASFYPTIREELAINTSTSSTPLKSVQQNMHQFEGNYVNFSYPDTWEPVERTPGIGATREVVELGIPRILHDQVLGFYNLPLEIIRPIDVFFEEKITIDDKPGYKWIRKDNDYVSYDYYVEGPVTDSVFGIHVTVPNEDKDLENKLDELVKSIRFSENSL